MKAGEEEPPKAAPLRLELHPPLRPRVHGVLPFHGVLDLGGGREDKVRKRGKAVRRRRGGGTHLSRRSNAGATPVTRWPKP